MKKKRESNPVAKFAGTFNHAATYRDRKNDYKRTLKHRGQPL